MEPKIIMQHLEEVENLRTTNTFATTITRKVIFLLITGLIGGTVYLGIKTKGNHFQRRMENLLKTLSGMRGEYKTRVEMMKNREHMHQLEQKERETTQDMRNLRDYGDEDE